MTAHVTDFMTVSPHKVTVYDLVTDQPVLYN
ncbi:hypothetical protein EDD68_1047 [Melghiribacillus thermohalophilus]|uniref:Uncharacterized protein n=1 Tax=Melghiribacillus thermohalophilus TaxID=1324956 RepID=A0A4R3N6Q2_9BACI|nr:hypothetical protein EDD68_1047 [Melghiribacillus thermohalophilus]